MMFYKVAVLIAISSGLAAACDCETPSVRGAKREADLVFRGTITQFRDSGKGWRIAVFKVSRVWKGDVHETLEMPAIEEGAACFGFAPRLIRGWNDLLVYATQIEPDSDYIITSCSRTALASETTDFKQLGPGRKPKP
jgi:hypothetical protein